MPLGAFPAALAKDLVARVSRRVAIPCRLVHGADPAAPRLPGRADQVDADRLLAAVEALATDPAAIRVGLTAQDVGSPLFTFFFGRARLDGRAALVSVARLSPVWYGLPDDPETTARRAVVEVLHEVGHAAGLAHCEDHACVMKVTATVDGIDLRGASYCARCAARLPPGLRRPA